MRRLRKEPLVHFLALGAVLFGIGILRGEGAGPVTDRIAITPGAVERLLQGFTIRHPWVVAFAFGLLHGFGFASGLTAMGLPQNEIPLALLFFNVGVELGQLAFVLFVLALVRSFRILEIRWPRWTELLPGYAVGALGAFWFIQRTVFLLGWM